MSWILFFTTPLYNRSNIINTGSQEIKGQARRKVNDKMDDQERFHKKFEAFLDFVEDNPEYYTAQRLKYLRDFASVASRFPSVYCDGDDTIRMPSPPEDRHLALTEGYV